MSHNMQTKLAQINICLLKQPNKDVDVQMVQETDSGVTILSFTQKCKDESARLVDWVVSNIPSNIKLYRVCISRGGTELYPIYTKLNLLGATVKFCD